MLSHGIGILQCGRRSKDTTTKTLAKKFPRFKRCWLAGVPESVSSNSTCCERGGIAASLNGEVGFRCAKFVLVLHTASHVVRVLIIAPSYVKLLLTITIVLGQGGQWAPVTGFDGTIRDNPFRSTDVQKVADTSEHLVEPFSPEFNARKSSDEYLLRPFPDETVLRQGSTTEGATTSDIAYHFPGSSAHIGGSDSLDRTCIGARSTAQARVFVGKKHGEGIFVDDPAFLAEWSVDAMKLVRRYLYRTGNGRIPIPGEQNWIERGHRAAATAEDTSRNRKLPLWASDAIDSTISLLDGETNPSTSNEARVKISNLSLMVSEVCELLDVMEDMMAVQRRRRLDLFRPPSWLRCNWYVIAAVAPPLTFLGGRLITKGYGRKVISLFAERVTEFFRERVVHPVAAM